jgi:Copper transport outer membrane protein, MctB
MSPDFRYHVASLAAVFLALGLGIVVGTAFFGTPTVDRLTRQIKRLESREVELREETRRTARSEEALRQLLPGLVRGTLADRHVLILQTGTDAEMVEKAVLTVQLAGGIPVRVTLASPENWSSLPTEEIAALARQIQGAQEVDEKTSPYFVGELPEQPIRLIVLVGGLAKEIKEGEQQDILAKRDETLIKIWQSSNITVVAVERLAPIVSFLPRYRELELPTVDCLDRVMGQMALPFLLRGEKGNFGMRPEATLALPSALESAQIPLPKPVTISPSPAPSPKP